MEEQFALLSVTLLLLLLLRRRRCYRRGRKGCAFKVSPTSSPTQAYLTRPHITYASVFPPKQISSPVSNALFSPAVSEFSLFLTIFFKKKPDESSSRLLRTREREREDKADQASKERTEKDKVKYREDVISFEREEKGGRGKVSKHETDMVRHTPVQTAVFIRII